MELCHSAELQGLNATFIYYHDLTSDTLVEFVLGQEVEELGEDGATFVHKVENRKNAGGATLKESSQN
jgi:hypothetical protein